MESSGNFIPGEDARIQLLEEFKARLEARLDRGEASFTDFSTWATQSITRLQRICGIHSTGNENQTDTTIKINHDSEAMGNQDERNLWMPLNVLDCPTVGEVDLTEEESVRDYVQPEVSLEKRGNTGSEHRLSIHGNKLENGRETENVTCYPTPVGAHETESRVKEKISTGKQASHAASSVKLSVIPNLSLWENVKYKPMPNLSPGFLGGAFGNSSSRGSSLGNMQQCEDPTDQMETLKMRGEDSGVNPSKIGNQRRQQWKQVAPVVHCEYCGKEYKHLGSLTSHLRRCRSKTRTMVERIQTGLTLSGADGMTISGPSKMYVASPAEQNPGMEMLKLKNLIERHPNPGLVPCSASFEQSITDQQFFNSMYPDDSSCQFYCRICGVPYPSLFECRQHVMSEHFDEVIKTPNGLTGAIAAFPPPRSDTPMTDLSSPSVLLSNALSSSPLLGLQGWGNVSPVDIGVQDLSFSPTSRIVERKHGFQPSSTIVSYSQSSTQYPTATQTEGDLNQQMPEPRQMEACKPSPTIYSCVYCDAEGHVVFDNFSSLKAHVAKHHLSTGGHTNSSLS